MASILKYGFYGAILVGLLIGAIALLIAFPLPIIAIILLLILFK